MVNKNISQTEAYQICYHLFIIFGTLLALTFCKEFNYPNYWGEYNG